MPNLTHPEIEERLLKYIRRVLSADDIAYIQPPVIFKEGEKVRTYKFRLTGVPREFTKVLILRVYKPDELPTTPHFEGLLLNTLYEQSFPAPQVLIAESSPEHIGSPFLIMQEIRGDSMFELHNISEKPYMQAARFLISGVGSIAKDLAYIALKLHLTDISTLVDKLTKMKFPVEHLSLNGRLYQLYKRVKTAELTRLEPGLIWLISHGPVEPTRLSVCHGQLYPNNVKKQGDVVTGVINWSMDSVLIGDPAYDVGRTSAAFKCVVPDVSPSFRHISANIGKRLARQFIWNYRQHQPISKGKIQYFEMVWCMDLAVSVGESLKDESSLLRKEFGAAKIDMYKTALNAMELFTATTDVPVMLPLV